MSFKYSMGQTSIRIPSLEPAQQDEDSPVITITAYEIVGRSERVNHPNQYLVHYIDSRGLEYQATFNEDEIELA